MYNSQAIAETRMSFRSNTIMIDKTSGIISNRILGMALPGKYNGMG
jgi:hypothetical protein